MILTIDVGNSRIKWAFWQGGNIIECGAAAYSKNSPFESFEKIYSTNDMFAATISRVLAVCVAENDVSEALNEWSVQHWGVSVEHLKTEAKYNNIIHAYESPDQHGADRWACVVAAHQSFLGSSVCVIGAGTAITIDLVSRDGQHLGGYIMPSYATMHKALLVDTANVKSIPAPQFKKIDIPVNTNDGVNQGLHKMIQAGIREICQLAKNKMPEPMEIVLTGGFAETILEYPNMPVMHHEPELVMHGLYAIMMSDELTG